ncbi:MAG: site-2 protease family protein [Planctomycetota bacterium]|nr:site-2 protease family protein [Planctomycetota bacterium]
MGQYLIAESQSFLSILSTVWVVLKAAIGLGFVIFVHELGHFVVAKLCGVKCEKFYVGFDVPIGFGPIRLPRTLGKFTWGETEYGIGIIPLGGYVKMLGQDDNPVNAQKEAERIKQSQVAPSADVITDGYTATKHANATQSDDLDPRSYPAQPVLQRMCIISAGVIMNVISGAVFAAIAYRSGVQIMPCEINGTSTGSPAWRAGLQPGDKFIQIGKDGKPDEFLRWTWDLNQQVVTQGLQKERSPLDLFIRRGNNEPKWYAITPQSPARAGGIPMPTLGVFGPRSTKLGSPPIWSYEDSSSNRFRPGDAIIGIDDEMLPIDEATKQIKLHELASRMQARFDQPVNLIVRHQDENGDSSEETIVLPPRRLRHLGLEMQIGPVVNVRKDSPAEQAGFAQGDVILEVDGKPIGDPITLPQRVAKMNKETLLFKVKRADQENVSELRVTLPADRQPTFAKGDYQSLEIVGVAYSVSTTVAKVTDKSKAEEQDIRPGDEIVQMTYVASGAAEQAAELKFGKTWNEPVILGAAGRNWTYVNERVQILIDGVDVRLTIQRSGSEHTATLSAMDSDVAWDTGTRGLYPLPFQRVHTAASWGEATALSIREIRERGTQVFQFLGLLATGQLSPKQLGGPVAIARMAGSEASRGIPTLLLFLTFLSVNLAILNFLPIPALDGGHMVFLSWEMLTGKPPNERLQMALTLVSVGCLLMLMLFVISNDIVRMFF